MDPNLFHLDWERVSEVLATIAIGAGIGNFQFSPIVGIGRNANNHKRGTLYCP